MHRCFVWFLLTVMLLLAVIASGCSPEEPSAPSSAQEALEYTEQTMIYDLAIRKIVGPDDTFGGELDKPIVYLVRATDDSIGDPDNPQEGFGSIPALVQDALTVSLEDLPSKIVWVDTFDDVELDSSTGAVKDGGVIVRLGNIESVTETSVRVPAAIYIGNMGSGGRTYVIEKIEGEWTLTRDTGRVWTS